MPWMIAWSSTFRGSLTPLYFYPKKTRRRISAYGLSTVLSRTVRRSACRTTGLSGARAALLMLLPLHLTRVLLPQSCFQFFRQFCLFIMHLFEVIVTHFHLMDLLFKLGKFKRQTMVFYVLHESLLFLTT